MVESVGKKLNQARVKRGLTIDEAAHATKLRPDKIAALETDDYSRFANNIYAKGFLQIYARFLNVDVTDFSRTLDNSNPISVSDYQYLTNAPAARPDSTQVYREERKPPSLAPLLFFVFFIGFVGALWWGFTKYQQLTSDRLTRHPHSAEDTTPSAATPEPTVRTPVQPAPPVVAAATPAVARGVAIPGATPVVVAVPVPRTGQLQLPNPAANLATPAPLARTEPSRNPDQDFVNPTAVSTSDPSTHPLPPGGVNEVLVATVKKTWVTVRKDDPKARPIFEDYVYPNANPLKLKGARFFIEARDPTAVQITKNGLPFAYQASNIPVQ